VKKGRKKVEAGKEVKGRGEKDEGERKCKEGKLNKARMDGDGKGAVIVE